MYKIIAVIAFVIIASGLKAQNKIEWSDDYEFSESDFQAEAPNSRAMQTVLGSYSVVFQVSGYNIVASRNLNKYVSCYFQKDASYLDDGDSIAIAELLRYQKLTFDIYELNARYLRQRFFNERKRVLLEGTSKLREEVSAEHSRLLARVDKETKHGNDTYRVRKWELWIKSELERLGDFCKECRPVKKKKEKR
jgi:hypothetical protein